MAQSYAQSLREITDKALIELRAKQKEATDIELQRLLEVLTSKAKKGHFSYAYSINDFEHFDIPYLANRLKTKYGFQCSFHPTNELPEYLKICWQDYEKDL